MQLVEPVVSSNGDGHGRVPEAAAVGRVFTHGKELGHDFMDWVDLKIQAERLKFFETLNEKVNLAADMAIAGVLVIALAAHPSGVVVGDPAAVRSGPARDFTEVAELRPGTRVTLRGPAAPWRRIQAPGGVEGWIRDEQVLPVPEPGGPSAGQRAVQGL